MARGYNSVTDVMRTTADGRDISELFAELQAAARIQNDSQQRFLDLFTFNTESAVTSVLQGLGAGDAAFEAASEYGIPQSKRPSGNLLNMGATFKWYDNRWASTWQYLQDASAAEVQSAANAILLADTDLIFREVMRTVFTNTNRSVTDAKTGAVYDVFALANGDGWVPATYEGNSFDGTHTHYRASGAATVTSGDLDEIIADFKSHGYSSENGSQIVIFVNSTEGDVISGFRVATGAKADFIAAKGASFFAANGDLIGTQPDAAFAGFPVKGAYDEALIIESSRIPAGYVVGMVSGGSLVPTNPVMFRQHPRIHGLQIIPGNKSDYPLIDSYWVRGFGTGVRHRAAAMVMKITAGAYSVPAIYA